MKRTKVKNQKRYNNRRRLLDFYKQKKLVVRDE